MDWLELMARGIHTVVLCLKLILHIYQTSFIVKYVFFPLTLSITGMGWICILFLTPWKSVIPVFSLSPIKNLKILLFTANHWKYCTRSPSSLKGDVSSKTLVVEDVLYDGRKSPKRIMDVYYSDSRVLMPIIILVYSVNWSFHKKEKWRKWAHIVQSNGYVVMIPEFTSVENGKLFEMNDDFLKCLQWVSNNATQFRGDVKRIYVVGVETGAHITMHCILDSIFNQMHSSMAKNRMLPPIYGVVFIDGIFDLTMHYSFEVANGIDDISVVPNLLLENERFSRLHPKAIFNILKDDVELINSLPNHWMFLVSTENFNIRLSHSQYVGYLLGSVRKHVEVEIFENLTHNDLILSVDHGLLIDHIRSFADSSSKRDFLFLDQTKMYAKAAYI